MADKNSRNVKKKNVSFWKFIGNCIWFVMKIPYYLGKGAVFLGKGIYHLFKKSEEIIEKRNIEKKRGEMNAKYEEFEVIEIEKGDYKKWFENILSSDSKIGVILGARGSGKTAFAVKLLENIYARTKKRCYAIGFDKDEMPSWIDVISDISEIKNNAFVLIDEGGVLFSSRNAMTNANKILSELILIARHKNLSILFISQNSSNLDVNILRQADFLIMKPSSLLQKDFERKIVQEVYEKTSKRFEKYKDRKGIAYIYGDLFRGFITNPLPSFWGASISKSFGKEKIKKA